MIYENDPSIESGGTLPHAGVAIRMINPLLLSGAMITAMAKKPDQKGWPAFCGTANRQRYSLHP